MKRPSLVTLDFRHVIPSGKAGYSCRNTSRSVLSSFATIKGHCINTHAMISKYIKRMLSNSSSFLQYLFTWAFESAISYPVKQPFKKTKNFTR